MTRAGKACQVALALFVGVFCMLDTALGDPLFDEPPVSYSVGDQPNSVAIGDLDGDNHLDLAVANEGTHNVSVLLGNGDGTFGAAAHYGGGTRCTSVAIGDLNGDDDPDLVVANEGSHDVSVLLGNGDGTFLSAANYSAGTTPSSVAIGDMDGINGPDLLVANLNSDNVSVLLGNGDGTFQGAAHYAAGDAPLSLAIGDLDADNYLDVVVANQYSSDVSVLLGNGNGTLGSATTYPLDEYSSPSSVAIGDLNEDTVPDLAVAKEFTHDVSVLLGVGDGTFQSDTDYPAGTYPIAVVIGDLDLFFGHMDVAVAARTTQARVSVLLGNGDGSLQAPDDYLGGGRASSMAIADLDRDAVPDLVVANDNNDTVSVFINLTAACNDTDGDGYGAPANPVCAFPEEDCDDGNPDVYPGALELCNGIDDDCEATTADGLDEPWLGADCDGPDTDACLEGTYSCQAGSQFCSDDTDNDIEVCDGIDNDCVPPIPPGETDDDGDQYVECAQWVGTDPNILGDNDCDDADPEESPGNVEDLDTGNCDDGKDNDCDGYVDSADCECSYTGCANAEASTFGSGSLTGSGVFNEFILLLIPVGAVILLKTLRRRR